MATEALAREMEPWPWLKMVATMRRKMLVRPAATRSSTRVKAERPEVRGRRSEVRNGRRRERPEVRGRRSEVGDGERRRRRRETTKDAKSTKNERRAEVVSDL